MDKLILIKYGELTTKKDNRNFFINTLEKNIKNLIGEDIIIRKDRVRMYIECDNVEEVALKLQKIFGIYSIVICHKVNNNTEIKNFTVEKGNTYISLAPELKKQNLIKSELFYKLYIKMNKPNNLTAGMYELSSNMDVKQIVNTLSNDDNVKDDRTHMTFREGLNVRQVADIIAKNTDFTADEVIRKINDKAYLDTLINKYWFLTNDIKNNQIYYALEGYLYPNTYYYKKEELQIEKIIEKMLDETAKQLETYKTQIQSSGYSVHQILTLASLIELEAVTDEDRKGVSGVFHNRLNNKWSLGSDVTTYYAAKKKMTESLTKTELNACNGYNTRCTSMIGLPVGPIDSPSKSSIAAAVNPTKSNYYFFVADKNKRVYFTKDSTEHNNIINKLKKDGLWIG